MTMTRKREAWRNLRVALNRLRYRAFSVHPTAFLVAGSRIDRSLVMGAYGYVGPGAQIPPGVRAGELDAFDLWILISTRTCRKD